jgi:hypothetical protein
MNKKSCTAATAAVFVAVAGILGITMPALAQQGPIDRVKMTDNELSCAQLHAESAGMDKIIAESKTAENDGNTTAMAGSAGNAATEVASRTGLFGAIGGLTGQLIGHVAGKTAADAAQQSGQSAAQQAATRGRQATARKETVNTLFLNKGCQLADLNHNQPALVQVVTAPVPAAEPVAAVGPVTALPDLDPDGFFKGQTGGTFGKNVTEVLPGNKRVAISGFRVAFITRNTATAQVRASYLPGRDTSGASSKLTVTLSGVDAAALQALTDRAYADFVAQLRLAGREVVTQEELQDFFTGVDAVPAGTPYVQEAGQQVATVFSPAGMPLWFHNGDGAWSDKGPFDQKNIRSLADYSQKINAIVIAPLIVVDFAQMSSSGNRSGLMTRNAETGAKLALSVSAFSSRVIRAEESRSGIVMKGDDAAISQTKAFLSDRQFGSLREVAASDNQATKGIFDALGKSMGLANAGGAARSKSENVAETSNDRYVAAAGEALQNATGTFARWFQKYPAR